MSTTLIMKQLQAPFPPEDVEWRVGAKNAKENASSGIALAYITNRAIQNRLDEIFGPFGWRNEFKEWKNNSQLCGISINWDGEWITKWDGADDSNEEAVKGGLSDAMKRAGYQWGIGRYLYNLEPVWVPITPRGKSYVLVEEPRLPDWALPEGYKYPEKTKYPAKVETTKKEEPPKASATTSSAPKTTTGNPGPMLSEAQCNYAQKLKKEKKISDDDFRRMVAEHADGNSDLYQMSKKQAGELINVLTNYVLVGA